MTSFFQTGRPELLSAIVEACGRVDEAIRKDHESVEFQLDQAHKERDAQVSKVTELTVKNFRLQEQVRVAKARRNEENSGNPSPSTSSRPADGSGSEGEHDWKAECRRVGSKFNALSENFKKAKDALRKRRDERDQWVEYAKALERKIRAAEEEHGIRIVERNTRSGRTFTNPDVKAEAGEPSPITSFTSDPGLEQADLELPPLAAASLDLEQDAAAAPAGVVNPQSESTQEGSDPMEPDDLPELPTQNEVHDVQIKGEPSSDPPVVVSERAVRKRKRDGPEPTESPLRKVKLESTVGSSPILSMGEDAADLQESIDLGNVAQRILTPRKRKQLEGSATGGQAFTNLVAVTTPSALLVRPDPNPQTARPLNFSSALTPLSVNSVNRRVTRPESNKPVTPFKRGLSHGISTLAEDGIIYKRGATEGQPKSAMKPIPKGRLDTLLNSPAAQDDETITRSNPRSRARVSVLQDDLSIPGRRELPFEQDGRPRDKTTVQQASTISRPKFTSTKLSPQDTRSPLAHKGSTSLLRNKPLSELRPDDFKVNPLTNDGHDFAYTEVVRDRNERACLQGCTDMHCCGKEFRALALSQRPNPPLTPAQRMEEQKLLEDYMGESAYRLGTMEKPERDELWVEAKTQELANKYGKHRYRFSRMRSPPGFWNADFPSTQELQADRAEAAKRDKQTVQERYREAMRPGGRWVFRDDQKG